LIVFIAVRHVVPGNRVWVTVADQNPMPVAITGGLTPCELWKRCVSCEPRRSRMQMMPERCR